MSKNFLPSEEKLVVKKKTKLSSTDLRKKLKKSKRYYEFLHSFTCDICGRECTSKHDYQTHKTDKKHTKMVKKILNWSCQLCHIKCSNKDELISHLRSRDHYATMYSVEHKLDYLTKYEKLYWHLRPKDIDTDVRLMKNPEHWSCCELCFYRTKSEKDWFAHLKTETHQNRAHILESILGRMSSQRPQCETCKINFDTKTELEEHFKTNEHLEGLRVEKYLKKGIIYDEALFLESNVSPQVREIDELLNDFFDPNLTVKHTFNNFWWCCELCGKKMCTRDQFKLHIRSQRHTRKVEAQLEKEKFTKLNDLISSNKRNFI